MKISINSETFCREYRKFFSHGAAYALNEMVEQAQEEELIGTLGHFDIIWHYYAIDATDSVDIESGGSGEKEFTNTRKPTNERLTEMVNELATKFPDSVIKETLTNHEEQAAEYLNGRTPEEITGEQLAKDAISECCYDPLRTKAGRLIVKLYEDNYRLASAFHWCGDGSADDEPDEHTPLIGIVYYNP